MVYGTLNSSEVIPVLSEALNTFMFYSKEEVLVGESVILQGFISSTSQNKEEGVIIVKE